jgi:hypothetical protein
MAGDMSKETFRLSPHLVQNPGVTGSVTWASGTYNGVTSSTYHNRWGPDAVGWNLADLDKIVASGPANGVKFPCTITINQGMKIECNANLWFNYTTDEITIKVNNNPKTEEVCRGNDCGELIDFSDDWTPLGFEWARVDATAARLLRH